MPVNSNHASFLSPLMEMLKVNKLQHSLSVLMNSVSSSSISSVPANLYAKPFDSSLFSITCFLKLASIVALGFCNSGVVSLQENLVVFHLILQLSQHPYLQTQLPTLLQFQIRQAE